MAGQVENLLKPFYAEDLEWKVQIFSPRDRKTATRALVVPYVDARAIMTRLDSAFGFFGWEDYYSTGPEGGYKCSLTVQLPDGTKVTREDGAQETDIEAIKGGFSSAFKRVAVKFGIGRYLYDAPAQWVSVKDGNPVYPPCGWPILPRDFYPEDADEWGRAPGLKTIDVPTKQKAETPKKKAPVTPVVVEQDNELRIPDNLPVPSQWKGKPLSEVAQDKNIGSLVIKWLAGEIKNGKGESFDPAGFSNGAELQAKAKQFLEVKSE